MIFFASAASSMQDFTLEVYSKTPNSEKIEHNSYQPAPTGNSRKPLFYLEDENTKIPLSNLGAETYAYKNSDSNTKSIDPKTMTFTHKADE